MIKSAGTVEKPPRERLVDHGHSRRADAIVRIWRSAWAWMPVDRTKGLFRLAWVATSVVGLLALVAASALALLA